MAQTPSPKSSKPLRPSARGSSNSNSPELPGIMGLMAPILLLYFTVQGFANGDVFFPFGFGLMGLYFFYAYVRNGLKVNFGSLTVVLNLVLLLGALVCLVLGIQNEAK